jgi:ATP synthase protein I
LWDNSLNSIDFTECLLYANKGCKMIGFSSEFRQFSTVFPTCLHTSTRLTFSDSEDAISMRKNNRHPLQAMALMSAIVSQLVGSILIGIFSGRWLDRQWDTEPIFLIIGLLIGLGAGTYSMLLSIRHFYSGDK